MPAFFDDLFCAIEFIGNHGIVLEFPTHKFNPSKYLDGFFYVNKEPRDTRTLFMYPKVHPLQVFVKELRKNETIKIIYKGRKYKEEF